MLAVNKLILLIIFLVVLLATLYLLFVVGKGAADPLLLQNELRQCCGTYRTSNCTDYYVFCSQGGTINDMRIKLNMSNEQLNIFCDCK